MEASLQKGEEVPSLGMRRREGNKMIFPWDPGILRNNIRMNRTSPPQQSWRKALDWMATILSQQIILSTSCLVTTYTSTATTAQPLVDVQMMMKFGNAAGGSSETST